MKIWPNKPAGILILAISIVVNIVLVAMALNSPPVETIADSAGKTGRLKLSNQPSKVSGSPARQAEPDSQTTAVPVQLAELYLRHNRTPLSETWPPSLSREWCDALGISDSDARRCDALLTDAMERMANEESARMKLIEKNGRRTVILEPAPPGSYAALLSDFESNIRKLSLHPPLADQFLEAIRNQRAEVILLDQYRAAVSIQSGFVHFQPIDEKGNKIEAGGLDLPVTREEGLKELDAHRFAHIYHALRSVTK